MSWTVSLILLSDWFGCHTTEPCQSIGTREIGLINSGWSQCQGNFSSAALESPNARDMALLYRQGFGLDWDDSRTRTLRRGGCPVFGDKHRFGGGECSRVFCDWPAWLLPLPVGLALWWSWGACRSLSRKVVGLIPGQGNVFSATVVVRLWLSNIALEWEVVS